MLKTVIKTWKPAISGFNACHDSSAGYITVKATPERMRQHEDFRNDMNWLLA